MAMYSSWCLSIRIISIAGIALCHSIKFELKDTGAKPKSQRNTFTAETISIFIFHFISSTCSNAFCFKSMNLQQDNY